MAPSKQAQASTSAAAAVDAATPASASATPAAEREGSASQSPTRPAAAAPTGKAGRNMLPARALLLPTSKAFVEDLCIDVDLLLDAFTAAWQEQCDELETSLSPCQVFAQQWEELGWDAVQFTWGESKATRANFWEATVRALTDTLKPLLPYITPTASSASAADKSAEIPEHLLLRGVAVLLALYVLCATTEGSVRILPSLEPSTSEEDPSDQTENGWMIDIEVDLYAVLLKLPALAGSLMDDSMSDMEPAPSDDLHYVLAALHGHHAPRRIMKLRGETRVFTVDEYLRTKQYRERLPIEPIEVSSGKKGRKSGAANKKAKGKGKAAAAAAAAEAEAEAAQELVEKTLPPISAFVLLAPTTYDARPHWPSNELANTAILQRQNQTWGYLVETLRVSSASINVHAAGGQSPAPQRSVKPAAYPLSRAELVKALIAERLGTQHYLPPSVPTSSTSEAQVSLPTDRAFSVKIPPKLPARLAYRPPPSDAAQTLVKTLKELGEERGGYAQILRRAMYPDDGRDELFGLEDDEIGGGGSGNLYLDLPGRATETMEVEDRKLREEIAKEARGRTKAAVTQGRKKQRTV